MENIVLTIASIVFLVMLLVIGGYKYFLDPAIGNDAENALDFIKRSNESGVSEAELRQFLYGKHPYELSEWASVVMRLRTMGVTVNGDRFFAP